MVNQTLERKAELKGASSLSVEEHMRLRYSRILTPFVNQQIEEPQFKRFCSASPEDLEDPIQVFALYEATQDYSELIHQLAKGDSLYVDSRSAEIIHGKIHEDIGFLVFAAKMLLDHQKIVLSPTRTVEVFRKIFPGHRLTKGDIGRSSLNNISVPDGLVLKWNDYDGVWEIDGYVEYTTTTGKLNEEHAQITANALDIQSRRGDTKQVYRPNTTLYWVEPRNFNDSDLAIQSFYSPLHLEFLPYTRDELGKFAYKMLTKGVDKSRQPAVAQISHKPWVNTRRAS